MHLWLINICAFVVLALVRPVQARTVEHVIVAQPPWVLSIKT